MEEEHKLHRFTESLLRTRIRIGGFSFSRRQESMSTVEAAIWEVLRQQAKTERVPGVLHGQSHLDQAFLHFIPDIHREHQEARTVIAVMGESGNGKTHTRKLIEGAIELQIPSTIPRDQEGYITTPSFSHLQVRDILSTATWEDEGEEAARKIGLIKTGRGQPFQKEELRESGFMLTINTATGIKKALVTDIEVPGLPADPDSQRPLGFTLIQDLFTHQGAFKQKPEETNLPTNEHDENASCPSYTPYAIILVAGPFLREYVGPVRNAFKNAPTLSEAQRIATIAGLPIPHDDASMKQMQAEGATLAQMINNETILNLYVDLFQRRGKIKPVTPGELEHAYKTTGTKKVTEQLKLNPNKMKNRLYRALMMGRYWEYVFKEMLKVPSKQVFIGFNNPTPEDLHIPDRYIPLLRRLLSSIS